MELKRNLMVVLLSDCQVLSLQLRKIVDVRTMASHDKMEITKFPNTEEKCKATCGVRHVKIRDSSFRVGSKDVGISTFRKGQL
jgi:hypothetical protein